MQRCTKRKWRTPRPRKLDTLAHLSLADKREFLKISQAVGVGFIVSLSPNGYEAVANLTGQIMGAIGYVVKLIHIPVNNILVS